MKQTIVAILVLVVVVAGGWYVYQMSSTGTISDENATTTAEQAGERTALSGSATYNVEPANSSIEWEGRKVLLENYTDNGTVDVQSGTIIVADGKLSGGEAVVDMTSLKSTYTANTQFALDRLDSHLKSDDFFGVETYPTASLEITDVKESGDMSYQVTADLTIKGTTKSVTFPATAYMSGDGVVVEATVEVDRTLFGVRFGSGQFFDNLGDNVIDDMFTLDVRLMSRQ